MAASINFESCAKRLLSPTNYYKPQRSIHEEIYEHSIVKTRNKQKLFQVKHEVHPKRFFSGQKYVITKIESVVNSAKNVTDSFKVWSRKTVSEVDSSYVSPLISADNLDVPKTHLSTDFLQTKAEKQIPTDVLLHERKGINKCNKKLNDEHTYSFSDDIKNIHIVGTSPVDPEPSELRKPKTDTELKKVKEDSDNFLKKPVKREQHDFYQAMTDKYESISSFYNSSQNKVISNLVDESSHKIEEDHNDKSFTKTGLKSSIFQRFGTNLPNMGFLPHLHFKKFQTSKIKKPVHEITRTVSKATIDKHTRELITSLKCATELTAKLIRLEKFCTYLLQHPESRRVAFQDRVIPVLLTWRQCKDVALKEQIQEALSMLGYVDPVTGRGIRVLSLDGGGTRGLVSIRILQEIERMCNRNLHEMFDYVCGVSTGSLIATLLLVTKVPLEKIELIYREFSRKVFNRYKAMGTVQLVANHSYYDSKIWEEVLKKNIGEKSLCQSARDPTCPKLSAVSAIMNLQKIENYIFRNYDYPQGVESSYKGSMSHSLWEAVKASSAAPGYFEECKFGDLVHQDGGVLTNNPTAIAIHECKLLWPDTPLQCVVSIGTGRFDTETDLPKAAEYSTLRVKLDKIIQSATDTEAVHVTVEDLLPPSTYFRLNPFLCENITLDEIRDDMWGKMGSDTDVYCKRNQPKFKKLAQKLEEPKKHYQRVRDWTKQKTDKYDLG